MGGSVCDPTRTGTVLVQLTRYQPVNCGPDWPICELDWLNLQHYFFFSLLVKSSIHSTTNHCVGELQP